MKLKELTLLYKLSRLAENTEQSLEVFFMKVVDVIAAGWINGRGVCTSISLKEKRFNSENFKATNRILKKDIFYEDKAIGKLEVFYTEELKAEDTTTFFKEEQVLLQEICSLLSGFYRRKNHVSNLIESNKQLLAEISERNLAEHQMEKSELDFNLLVKSSPGVIYKCSLDDPWEMNFISDKIEILSGYPKEEFLGLNPIRPFGEIMHPDDREEASKLVQIAIDQKESYKLAYRVIHKDGHINYVFGYGQASYKSDGTPDYLVGVIFNDTDRIVAVNKVKESEERFQLAAKGSNAGIWDLDVSSKTAYWSDIHYNLLGYEVGEIEPTLDFVQSSVYEEDLPFFKSSVRNHIVDGSLLDFEARFYTKNKELRWFRSIGASTRDKNGKAIRIVGSFTDITEKKEAENTLARKEQQLRDALDVSNEGIWELKKGEFNIEFSDRCYTMLGYLPVESKDESIEFWSTIINKEGSPKALVYNVSEIMINGLHDNIYRVKANDGENKWIHTKGKVVEFSNDGSPLRIVGTMSDISERMRQEEKVVNAILETEDKERSRIASDIHDGLQQTMTTSLMSFEKVRYSTDFQDKEVYDRFHMGYKFLKKAIKESRTLAHNLMPKVVDKDGIVAAIESLVNAITNSSETVFEFNQNLNEERIKLSVEMTLYRITQETINNIVKYANAEKCNIQLFKYSDVLILTIEDNGDGFDLSKTVNSFGINSMRTRAESIGAFFEINSRVGKGTQILVELPLKN